MKNSLAFEHLGISAPGFGKKPAPPTKPDMPGFKKPGAKVAKSFGKATVKAFPKKFKR